MWLFGPVKSSHFAHYEVETELMEDATVASTKQLEL